MEVAVLAALAFLMGVALWLGLRLNQQATAQQAQADVLLQRMEAAQAGGHRAMLNDLAAGLDRLGDRMTTAQTDSAERQRALVDTELRATREAMQALHLAMQALITEQGTATATRLSNLATTLLQRQEALKTEMLSQTLEKLAEAARADRELLQDGLRKASLQQAETTETLTRTMNERLDAIAGVVNVRLD